MVRDQAQRAGPYGAESGDMIDDAMGKDTNSTKTTRRWACESLRHISVFGVFVEGLSSSGPPASSGGEIDE